MKKNINKYIKFTIIVFLFNQLDSMEDNNNKRHFAEEQGNNKNLLNKKPRINECYKELSILEDLPYEFIEIIHKKAIESILNNWNNINDFRQIKEAIEHVLFNMPLVSKHINKHLKYDKDNLRKSIRLLIYKRLSQLIEENKKDYQGEYKGLSQKELNDKLASFLDPFNDYNKDNQEIIFTQIVKLILAGANLYIQKFHDITTAVIQATKLGHADIVQLLIAAGVDINYKGSLQDTTLIWAATYGHTKIAQLLIEMGADVNHSARYYDAALIEAARNGNSDIVKLLIDNNTNINITNNNGDTALIWAAQNGHTGIVKLLINNNANTNINIQNNRGDTALIKAALKGYKDIVKILINNNANVNHKTSIGVTALHLARFHKHEDIIKLLINAGAVD